MKSKSREMIRYAIDFLRPMQLRADLTETEMLHLKFALRELAAADCCETCMKRQRARMHNVFEDDDLPF